MPLILASASPRRKELLERIGFKCEVLTADIDEHDRPSLEPADLVMYLAKAKVEAIVNTALFTKISENSRLAYRLNNQSPFAVIGADTIVVLNNNILEKPSSYDEARHMLNLLSGQVHTVFTGVSINCGCEQITFYDRCQVKFYELTEEIINYYLSTGDSFDKAGAYGIQGRGSILIEGIEGNYETVMGLPTAQVFYQLRKLAEKNEISLSELGFDYFK